MYKYIKLLRHFCYLKNNYGSLTLSWWISLSYRNQSIDLQSKSIDSFLHDTDLRHQRVNQILSDAPCCHFDVSQKFYIASATFYQYLAVTHQPIIKGSSTSNIIFSRFSKQKFLIKPCTANNVLGKKNKSSKRNQFDLQTYFK